jgi:hypothetical protein
MMAWSTQYTLNHWDNARRLEQLRLLRIFLKNPCEGEPFYRTLAVVVGWRLDGDVGGVIALAIFYCQEAGSHYMRWAQAQENIEERTRGPCRRFHGHYAYLGRKCSEKW